MANKKTTNQPNATADADISRMARVARELSRRVIKPLLDPKVPIAWQRRGLTLLSKSTLSPSSVNYSDTKLANVKTLTAKASQKNASKPSSKSANKSASKPAIPATHAILYLHGGAYCVGSPEVYKSLIGHLALNNQADVYAPDYRLAPEHPFPAALDDALAAYHHLRQQNPQYQQITIMGDSAGGGLALALAITIRDHGHPPAEQLVLFSPFVDLTCRNTSHRKRADRDVVLKTAWLQSCAADYCQHLPHDHPLCSPLFSPLHNLPRTLIQVGTEEILLDDSQRLATLMTAQDTDCTLSVHEGMWHVFQSHASLVPEAADALTAVQHYLEPPSN